MSKKLVYEQAAKQIANIRLTEKNAMCKYLNTNGNSYALMLSRLKNQIIMNRYKINKTNFLIVLNGNS